TIDKLKLVQNNITKNNELLQTTYYHTYPLLTILGKQLEDVIKKSETFLTNFNKSVVNTKNNVILKVKDIDNNVNTLLNKGISEIDYQTKIIYSYIKSFNEKFYRYSTVYMIIFIIIIVIVLLFILIMIVLLIILIYKLLQENITKNYIKIVRSFSFISAILGFISIFILLLGIIFLSISLLGTSSCSISHSLLNNNLNIQLPIPIPDIEYCIKNKNASIVRNIMPGDIIEKIHKFDFKYLDDILMKNEQPISEAVFKYKDNIQKVLNSLWLVVVHDKNNKYIDRIHEQALKTSLLISGITRDNIHIAGFNIFGTDDYIKQFNETYFTGPLSHKRLCFEDVTCK
ncbi:conserved membrane protein, unknown function, partial [Hepatocystis sp. ex Piliocolobus tephrosceles]